MGFPAPSWRWGGASIRDLHHDKQPLSQPPTQVLPKGHPTVEMLAKYHKMQ